MPIPDIAAVETALFEKTNAVRSEKNLAPISQNTFLKIAARAYATYLADKGLFSHTADGWSIEERVNIEGYKWCRLSENLSMRAPSQNTSADQLASNIIEGWMKSPKHRINVLEPNVTETGVGVAVAGEDAQKFISVQLFARPQSFRYQIIVKNMTYEPISYALGAQDKIASARMTVRHSLCDPQTIEFRAPKEKKISGRYQTKDNTVFLVTEDKDNSLKVEIMHP
ncbi:MAG: CAP domain-containing protein [Hyphomicrobium sp.]